MDYDFSDEQIRDMIEMNHKPIEPPFVQQADGNITSFDDKIRCERDNQIWPCPVIRKLREWRRGMGEDRVTL